MDGQNKGAGGDLTFRIAIVDAEEILRVARLPTGYGKVNSWRPMADSVIFLLRVEREETLRAPES